MFMKLKWTTHQPYFRYLSDTFSLETNNNLKVLISKDGADKPVL